MTTKPRECQKDDTQLLPLQYLLELRHWGKEWKRTINKTNEWVAWRWMNVKIDKKKSCNVKRNCKHFKGGYGRLPLGDVYTCHGFFKITFKFEKTHFQKKKSQVYSTICR
jgi:hypothetical protein